ncbi:alpha/beta hydrolase [Brachybacterium endophyticum]|uniref:Alpha/beta hydrolase n=1 Tax=Brachybacterium endophyticum TaxID=2182385 RepID=A0A2U2RN65_9MICO|nr:alpha/beta hydrolase [Brachybacterium endophyticum]PWH07281.1 alpha/beta hydrolase [Brachybacterium endophyticum]
MNGHESAPRLLDLDGVEVATWRLGPRDVSDSRGDVVLCHGTPWSSVVWADVARDLARDHTVHLWDMPGYGRSAMDGTAAIDLATQMGRLARLLDRLDLARPHLVAHDVGGAVALGAHLLEGRELASLMLWDPVVLEPWGSAFFRLVAENAETFSALPLPLHRALVREYIVGAARRPLPADTLDALAGPWGSDVGERAFYRQIAALRPEHTRPVAAELGDVRCRVSIGWGEDDPWIPVSRAARLSALLPGAPEPHVLPGVGHLAPLEAPEAVTRLVGEWVRESATGIQPNG